MQPAYICLFLCSKGGYALVSIPWVQAEGGGFSAYRITAEKNIYIIFYFTVIPSLHSALIMKQNMKGGEYSRTEYMY